MKALSLNCRGLGNQATVAELHGLVKLEVPKLVFLMETRLPVRRLEFLRVKLGMYGCFGVDRRRLGGGLALLWDASITIHIQSYSPYHIDTHVFQEDNVAWRFTGFYGHPETALRIRSWSLLRCLHGLSDKPWLVLGDFNEIMALEEKCGREDRSFRQMARFREALSDCSLSDLGFVGPEFTWSNNREDDELVRVRLDRGVASQEWRSLFPKALVRHISVVHSDHIGLLLELVPCIPQVRKKKSRLFRFDHSWVHEEDWEGVIAEAWSSSHSGTPMFCLAQKIKQCRLKLLQWSQSQARPTPRNIESKKRHLQELESQKPESYNAKEVNLVRKELCSLMRKEETYWKQRSRVAWLHGGDSNTRFFHECASQRKKTNTVHGLRDTNDIWQTDSEVIESIVVEYFQNLFSSSNPTAINEVTQLVDARVTPEMNSSLLSPFSSEEIKSALFQMSPSKAPGPDGMTTFFFSKILECCGCTRH